MFNIHTATKEEFCGSYLWKRILKTKEVLLSLAVADRKNKNLPCDIARFAI